ncbi:MAG: family 10 glycosylhydrolase, partial [Candidatus Marinimicrobia bacterium]|nr:family 10 glycosylhydrolase [Candidatus Neomarinimicrobiota bacterium]
MNRFVIFCAGFLLISIPWCSKKINYEKPIELRAVGLNCIGNNVISNQRSIAEVMHFLGENHFNGVFPLVQVSLFDSIDGTKKTDALRNDVFNKLILEAHRQELKILPIIDYQIFKNEEKWTEEDSLKYYNWLVRDSLGNILEYHNNNFINVFNPDVRKSIIKWFNYLLNEYDFDGIVGGEHLFLQPADGVYSDYIQKQFLYGQYGEQLSKEYNDTDWHRWYREEMNRNIRTIYKEVKKNNPDELIYWIVNAVDKSNDNVVQDWPNWLNGGYADLIIPIIDQKGIAAYNRTLDAIQPDSISLFRNK